LITAFVRKTLFAFITHDSFVYNKVSDNHGNLFPPWNEKYIFFLEMTNLQLPVYI